MPIRAFKNSITSILVFATSLSAAALFGLMLFIPLFLQSVLGTSAKASGEESLPGRGETTQARKTALQPQKSTLQRIFVDFLLIILYGESWQRRTGLVFGEVSNGKIKGCNVKKENRKLEIGSSKVETRRKSSFGFEALSAIVECKSARNRSEH